MKGGESEISFSHMNLSSISFNIAGKIVIVSPPREGWGQNDFWKPIFVRGGSLTIGGKISFKKTTNSIFILYGFYRGSSLFFLLWFLFTSFPEVLTVSSLYSWTEENAMPCILFLRTLTCVYNKYFHSSLSTFFMVHVFQSQGIKTSKFFFQICSGLFFWLW